MIKKLTIIAIIALAFFMGYSLGSELSPSQLCLDIKKFYAKRYGETYSQLEMCQSINYSLMTEFYDYEDGLWQLKRGLRAWRAWTKEWQEFWDIQEIEDKISI